jgi:uncharacterized protein YukE
MARVVSSDEARQAVTQMQSIINGGLSQEIRNLGTQGRILVDPHNWDGSLASQFRGEVWPQTETALNKVLTELEQLRQKISQINTDIMTAGGNT